MKTGYAASIVLVLFAAGFAGAYTFLNAPERVQSEGAALIGGPFSLVDTDGKRVTDRDFRGKLMLVFFGYTHCPDVCPTELQTMSDGHGQARPRRLAKLRRYSFPSIRSAIRRKRSPDYMKNFNSRITGLTGNQNEIANAAKAYRVYYRKAGDSGGGDYTVDHSAFVYLMDGEGKYLTHFSFNTAPESMLSCDQKENCG